MEYKQNEQLKLAADFVSQTNINIFLTGRAGTGKTTFLKNLPSITPKRMVVVAPTGVAAINAGGVTIHSFFQLGFSPFIPAPAHSSPGNNQAEEYQKKFNRNKIKLIKCIDLLVIDEISMVRADMLDAVDHVLRRFRNRTKPFGGVQLLMIGDLFQLCPVVKDDDWRILKAYYPSPFFFDSLVLKKSPPVIIELKEIFRQTDAFFIELLNKVRESTLNQEVIATINSRYNADFNPDDEEGFIRLTTHNATATSVNRAKLEMLSGEMMQYSASIDGEFPTHDLPTEPELGLKVNAQVMFIKNDMAVEKAYYNGKIGIITRLTDDTVYVKCAGDDREIAAKKVTWENIRFKLNERTREIDEEVIGTFEQIPLKLAWAITIHKSQGLTFDRVIIDAQAAFASGQVYVALSRCRTFEGIVLSTPIRPAGIKTDQTVRAFSRDARQQEPGAGKLETSKHAYQVELTLDLFELHGINYHLEALLRNCRTHLMDDGFKVSEKIAAVSVGFSNELLPVARKFKAQLVSLMDNPAMPEENARVQERVRKAVAYFSKELDGLWDFLTGIEFELDNKATAKLLNESLEKLQREVYLRLKCLAAAKNGFHTLSQLRAKSDADLDFRKPSPARARTIEEPGEVVHHPQLLKLLKEWRKKVAEQRQVPAYRVLPQMAILEISRRLPTTPAGLKSVKGIGSVKMKQYGGAILEVVFHYISENDIETE